MTVAEELRKEGIGGPNFTKESLMRGIKSAMHKWKSGSVTFIVGKHVSTDFDRQTIGTCNPYNRSAFIKWITEEGFKYESDTNRYGVEHITVMV